MYDYLISFIFTETSFFGDITLRFNLPLASSDIQQLRETIRDAAKLRGYSIKNFPVITSIHKFERIEDDTNRQ